MDPKPTPIQIHTYKGQWCWWQQSHSTWHNYLYSGISQEIPTTVHSLQTSTSTYYLRIRFCHNYLIGIKWFSTKQLHLYQGPWSTVVSDPTPFTFHIKQISTLPEPHRLVKTISQVTVPTRTLAIIPTSLTSAPKPNCYYNLTGTQSSSEQNLFLVPLLKIFSTKLPVHLLCTIINTSPNDVILPKN